MKKLSCFLIVIALWLLAQPVFAQQDETLFRKHIISSGWHGLYYGTALNIIFEIPGAAAAGIPIISAGTAAVIPLLTNSSRSISNNSLVLTNHGKYLGWVHGFALPSLILGEDAWNEKNYKITVASGALSSIALGRLGYVLGRDKDWEEGQTALFSHYGWVMPFAGLSLGLAFVDDLRLGAGLVLLSGAGGYFLANKIFELNPYTRGDVRSTQVLSTLNGGLAFGLMIDKNTQFDEEWDFKRSDWIIPALGMLAGTAIGHLWLKDARLTTQQANITAYAAGGGAIIGLGVALLSGGDKLWPYYTFPYAFGMGAYAFAVERFKKENSTLGFLHKEGQSNLNIAFMPQNLLINQKLAENGLPSPGRTMRLQPLFSASYKF